MASLPINDTALNRTTRRRTTTGSRTQNSEEGTSARPATARRTSGGVVDTGQRAQRCCGAHAASRHDSKQHSTAARQRKREHAQYRTTRSRTNGTVRTGNTRALTDTHARGGGSGGGLATVTSKA